MEQSEKMNRITGGTLLQQKQEEFLLLQQQAQEGNVIAQYNVGICYLYGQNTKVDYSEAFLWFEKAAQQGDKLAGLFMGCFNELGVDRNINYSQAITYYKTYSPSITEVDKTALWEKAKKIDEIEIEKNLSEIYQKANKIGEAILKIKGFCVYYPKDNSFNFKWTDNTRSEFKQPLDEYNKLVEEFKIYIDAYTSDTDDEKYGYWIYLYEDILNLTYEICNALVGRDTLYRYLDKVGLPAIEKNKNFEFALGRCLIDDNDNTDNDYIISGLLLVAGHDEDPIWQNKVGLWYEFRNENKDLLQAEKWYKKAANLKLSSAEVNIERLKGKKEYKLITDKTEGSSEDRLKVVKTIRGNEELRNKWLLSSAILGNETASEQLAATIDVKGNSIYNKTCIFEPSWKKIEIEQVDCKKKIDTWKQIVDNKRKKYIEEERRRIKEEEEARRKAAEEEARRRAAEEEARRKAEEEEERRRQAELDAMLNDKPSSKKWLWILILLLLVGIGAGYYFMSSKEGESSYIVETDSIAEIPDEAYNEDEGDENGPISFTDALRVAEEMVIKNDDFKGFRSPDNVKNIMAKNGYKYAGKYYVDREFLFDVLYYKDCLLGTSSGKGCYSNVPQANGSRNPSFVGIENSNLLIAPFTETAFDMFLNQAKEFGATVQEEDESTITYRFLSFNITGFKEGVFSIRYLITISKEESDQDDDSDNQMSLIKELDQLQKLYLEASPQENKNYIFTKYCYIDLDDDSNNEIWLRAKDDKHGAFFIRNGDTFQLIATEDGRLVPSFHQKRGNVGYLEISGSAGGPSFFREIIEIQNSHIIHRFSALLINDEIEECSFNGKTMNNENGQQYLESLPSMKNVATIWRDVPN